MAPHLPPLIGIGPGPTLILMIDAINEQQSNLLNLDAVPTAMAEAIHADEAMAWHNRNNTFQKNAGKLYSMMNLDLN